MEKLKKIFFIIKKVFLIKLVCGIASPFVFYLGIVEILYRASDSVYIETFVVDGNNTHPLPFVEVKISRNRVPLSSDYYPHFIDQLLYPDWRYGAQYLTDAEGKILIKKTGNEETFYQKKNYDLTRKEQNGFCAFFEPSLRFLRIRGPEGDVLRGDNVLYKFDLLDENGKALTIANRGSFHFTDSISGNRLPLTEVRFDTTVNSETDSFSGIVTAQAGFKKENLEYITANEYKFSVYNEYLPRNFHPTKGNKNVVLENNCFIIYENKYLTVSDFFKNSARMISFRYKTSTEKISALVQICGAEFLIGGESQDRITTRKIANGSQNQYSKIINVENNQLEAELPSNTIIELKIESFQLGKNTDKFLFTFFFKFFPVAPRNPRALKPVILEAIISNADSHSPLRIGVAPNSENDKGNLSVDHIKYY